MMCEACERGDCEQCGMQTWCECDCAGPEGFYFPDPSDADADEDEARRDYNERHG